MTRMSLFKSLDVLASWPADLHLVFSKGCRSWVGLAGQTLSNQTFAQTYPGKPTLLPKYKISIEWSRTIRYPPKTCWHFRGQDSIGTVAILYVADTQKDKSSYKSSGVDLARLFVVIVQISFLNIWNISFEKKFATVAGIEYLFK